MEHIDIILADTRGPFSTLIKAVTWSRWSHAALVINDGMIAEATLQGGVHYSSLEGLKKRSNAWVVLRVPVKSRDDVILAMDAIIGRPYDLQGVFGIGIKRDWQENDAFWCSEAVYYAIHKTGNEFFRAEAMHRITPEHLWMLSLEIVGASA